MLFYWYKNSHCADQTVIRLSYLHNGISYTSKVIFFIESAPWIFNYLNTIICKTFKWYRLTICSMLSMILAKCVFLIDDNRIPFICKSYHCFCDVCSHRKLGVHWNIDYHCLVDGLHVGSLVWHQAMSNSDKAKRVIFVKGNMSRKTLMLTYFWTNISGPFCIVSYQHYHSMLIVESLFHTC